MAELNWSDGQWQKVNDAVNDAFNKASVASAFLPMYGPLSGSAEIVRNERLKQPASKPRTISLDADHDAVNLKLVNLTVNVELSNEQVAEEALSNALLAFRRAANILALEEDGIVFNGFDKTDTDASPYVANTVQPQKGLADLGARQGFAELKSLTTVTVGQAVVTEVVAAIGRLETSSNPSPFACVLGNELFNRVHDPAAKSLVLPADRITPLLQGGPLLRSGRMDSNTGVVISLAGNAVDIVVGTPPTAQFLQRKDDARFLFRVYERFVLRIRDEVKPPIAGFWNPDPGQMAREATALETLAKKAEALSTTRVTFATLRKDIEIL